MKSRLFHYIVEQKYLLNLDKMVFQQLSDKSISEYRRSQVLKHLVSNKRGVLVV